MCFRLLRFFYRWLARFGPTRRDSAQRAHCSTNTSGICTSLKFKTQTNTPQAGNLSARANSREKQLQQRAQDIRGFGGGPSRGPSSRGSVASDFDGGIHGIDNYSNNSDRAVLDRLDLGLGSLAIDPEPSDSSDPDVWPPPTPDPSRPTQGSLAGAMGSAASSSASAGGGGGGINGPSRVRREDAATALAGDKARQRLPAWARAATPNSAVDKRGGVGGGGRRDGAVRGRMVIAGGAGGGGGGGGVIGPPRRGSRGEINGMLVRA